MTRFETYLKKVAREELRAWLERVNDPFFVGSDDQCEKQTTASLGKIRDRVSAVYPKYDEERETSISKYLLKARKWCDAYWREKKKPPQKNA